jgi:hypothetical protein
MQSRRRERLRSVTEDLSEALARRDPRALAAAVGEVVSRPDPPVGELEARLDGWAAGDDEALAVAAVTAYGEVATVRPEWVIDETRKLVLALTHPNEVVRAAAAEALRRIRVSGVEKPALPHSDDRQHSDGTLDREPPT